jgi:hypothetical protein
MVFRNGGFRPLIADETWFIILSGIRRRFAPQLKRSTKSRPSAMSRKIIRAFEAKVAFGSL